jgi:tetratricopeptide (TPR) repeat protein
MMKYILNILLLVITFASFVFPRGELEKQLNYARTLYDQENYFDSVTELKRLLFFDTSKHFTYEANILMGSAYKKGALLNDAVSCFSTAERFAGTDEEKYTALVELVRVNILRRTTEQALKIIQGIESAGKYKDKQQELDYWKGWAYIFANEFEKASNEFDKIRPDHELKTLSDNTSDQLCSESIAKILSVFIPGAGQIYTGSYLNGIISLGWNIFAGYLTINSFAEDRVFDGIITANLLWLRFYIGGIQNAEEFARENNTEVINKTLLYLQNEYKGLKP